MYRGKALGSGHRARREGEKGVRRRKGMAERQENGRLKESAGFPLDVKAPIEAVAQRACTPDNDGNAFHVAPRILSLETDQIFIDITYRLLLVNANISFFFFLSGNFGRW